MACHASLVVCPSVAVDAEPDGSWFISGHSLPHVSHKTHGIRISVAAN